MWKRNSLVKCTLAVLVAVGGLQATPITVRADDAAIAIVNGEAISRDEMFNLLLESHGVRALQQLALLQVARQATRSRNITVRQLDIEREFEKSLDALAREAGLTGAAATRENKLAALQKLLQNKGISRAEFDISMERNAHLRKLIEQDIGQIEEKTLREDFARTYGAQVVIRHIQIPAADAQTLNLALSRLGRGDAFAEVARDLSRNPETAPRGGEMEPFSFADRDIPAGLREAAFGLQPGERSPAIRTGRFFHILKLERRIPPSNVRFEDVRDEVQQRMLTRVVAERMSALTRDLFRRADVRVLHPTLKRDYTEFRAESEDVLDLP